jgi:medium-chain acyl-[acyl-carrier-protein] hydrolase
MENFISHKKRYKVRIEPQSVDFQQKITPAALMDMLLTTSGLNADDNGFGMRKLNEMRFSWVLSRLAVEMKRYPLQYEHIEIEIWLAEVGRTSTIRNFSIYDSEGNNIGNACSIWVMIHVDTRRPVDLDLLDGVRKFANGDMGNIEKPIKLSTLAGEAIDSFMVKYADIDINQHVNTCRYVEWVSNCFDLDTYRKKSIKRLEINFMNEIFFGERVDLLQEEFDTNDIRFEIRKNGKCASLVRVVF